MALVKCPECTGTVSDQAASCPHCGRPLREPRKSHVVRTIARSFAPALLAAVFAVSLAASLWSWLSTSSIGSPVNVGAAAVVVPGGLAPLVNEQATLGRMASDQKGARFSQG